MLEPISDSVLQNYDCIIEGSIEPTILDTKLNCANEFCIGDFSASFCWCSIKELNEMTGSICNFIEWTP